MGVLQLCGDPDLAEKTLAADRRGKLRPEHLDRDLPLMPDVLRQVHRRHPALAQLALERVPVRKRGKEAGRDVGHERNVGVGRGHRKGRWDGWDGRDGPDGRGGGMGAVSERRWRLGVIPKPPARPARPVRP